MEYNPPPPEGNINYSIHMQKLCFLYDEKAVPASRSQGRQKKMESPTFRKTALIHHMKEIINIKTNLHTEYLRKVAKNGEHRSPPGHTFMWCLA